jgi:hypothetical protein
VTSVGPFVLGYHGCSRNLGEKALAKGLSLSPSNQDYDWLGPGVYFWENDSQRALEWAEAKVARGSYKEAFVIGAAIELRNCLDLTLRENLDLLSVAYAGLKALRRASGLPLPKNKDIRSRYKGDKLLRFRDCAVIRHLHALLADPITNQQGADDFIEPFDTVRGLFVEGNAVYPGGGFYRQAHTQIAVISPACIKGIFKPR